MIQSRIVRFSYGSAVFVLGFCGSSLGAVSFRLGSDSVQFPSVRITTLIRSLGIPFIHAPSFALIG
ncbi:hypothetical protein HanIR_Chr13g0628751 [Helianthus annuus]|nr:hypothetical protein HanIR_Chr13g0628751 [Helianthus annuus]